MGLKIKRHLVLIKSTEGQVDVFPMKSWVRDNLENLQLGIGITGYETSHKIRSLLKSNGWQMHVEDEKVLLVRPDENEDFSFAEKYLLESEEEENNEVSDILDDAHEITFSLERDMQRALRQDISQLESGLEIIDGGKEKTVESGRIDITAKDKNGNIVVIELKAGWAPPKAVAQLLAYMGDIKEKEKKDVRGILIASGFHKKVISAVKVLPTFEIKKYSFQFKFTDET